MYVFLKEYIIQSIYMKELTTTSIFVLILQVLGYILVIALWVGLLFIWCCLALGYTIEIPLRPPYSIYIWYP